MVKVEKNSIVKFSGKGLLMSVGVEGILLQDQKEGTQDLISFEDLKSLIGKEITVAIQNKEVEE